MNFTKPDVIPKLAKLAIELVAKMMDQTPSFSIPRDSSKNLYKNKYTTPTTKTCKIVEIIFIDIRFFELISIRK